eukprot:TRINITY_DN877_c0_g1_i11.p1 TRINITY_DN877_c0_g1~~TRINITY_DN877_c0_g1_i11.p1  ORF type:complete len:129 (+),score=16.15 TRINITY_DN877_c0_g1_i11:1540-1926(+)
MKVSIVSLLLLFVVCINSDASSDLARELVRTCIEWSTNLGWMGPIFLGLMHVIAVALCFPGSILFEWTAGAIFGLFWGYVYHLMDVLNRTRTEIPLQLLFGDALEDFWRWFGFPPGKKFIQGMGREES